MGAPPIQYARTDDGVNIAYWTLGDGPTVIISHYYALSYLDREWEMPALREWYEELARDFTVVRYNRRGTGQSDRENMVLSNEGFVLDLEAVVHAVGGEHISLMSSFMGTPIALDYAAKHPDVVSRLVLFEPYEVGAAWVSPEVTAAVQTASTKLGFNIVSLVAAFNMAPDGTQNLEGLLDLLNQSYSVEATQDMLRAVGVVDTRGVLPDIAVATLVIGRREPANIPWGGMTQAANVVAANIPNSRLIMVAGSGTQPYFQNASEILDHVRSFLWEEPETPEQAAVADNRSAIRIMLFSDVEDSTLLTAEYGDAQARELLVEHERLTRQAIAEHGGDEIKTMGDGFMVAFDSASGAIDAAVDMQRAITSHFAESPTPMRIRIGINAGEPIAEGDDLYGTAVIQAARIMSHADGGEILVSDTVRNLVAGKEYLFSQKGEYDLKGFEEPVRLFEVRWQDTD